MQLPPGTPARSITATRLPKYAAWAPAFSPAGPHPITTRSKRSSCFMECASMKKSCLINYGKLPEQLEPMLHACDESRIRSIQEIARGDFVDGGGLGI